MGLSNDRVVSPRRSPCPVGFALAQPPRVSTNQGRWREAAEDAVVLTNDPVDIEVELAALASGEWT